jgi:hypothetical protein
MAQVRGDDRTLKELVRRHVVFDEKTEIDDTLRHVFPHSYDVTDGSLQVTGLRPSRKQCRVCRGSDAMLD